MTTELRKELDRLRGKVSLNFSEAQNFEEQLNALRQENAVLQAKIVAGEAIQQAQANSAEELKARAETFRVELEQV